MHLNSVVYAVLAATIGTTLSYSLLTWQLKPLLGRTIPDLLTVIGGSTPSIYNCVGVGNYLRQLWLELYSTFGFGCIYLVKYMTMSVRTIAASLSQVHSSLEEAALLRC